MHLARASKKMKAFTGPNTGPVFVWSFDDRGPFI